MRAKSAGFYLVPVKHTASQRDLSIARLRDFMWRCCALFFSFNYPSSCQPYRKLGPDPSAILLTGKLDCPVLLSRVVNRHARTSKYNPVRKSRSQATTPWHTFTTDTIVHAPVYTYSFDRRSTAILIELDGAMIYESLEQRICGGTGTQNISRKPLVPRYPFVRYSA